MLVSADVAALDATSGSLELTSDSVAKLVWSESAPDVSAGDALTSGGTDGGADVADSVDEGPTVAEAEGSTMGATIVGATVMGATVTGSTVTAEDAAEPVGSAVVTSLDGSPLPQAAASEATARPSAVKHAAFPHHPIRHLDWTMLVRAEYREPSSAASRRGVRSCFSCRLGGIVRKKVVGAQSLAHGVQTRLVQRQGCARDGLPNG